MGSVKKKPKPSNEMSKRQRVMVVISLGLVIMGCFALYYAMQNEDWTKDEPSQRRVFFLAFVLLISSIGLCYYALNEDLDELKERMKSETEHLTSIKYGGYNSFSSSAGPRHGQQGESKPTERKLLQLLAPGNPSLNVTRGDETASGRQYTSRGDKTRWQRSLNSQSSPGVDQGVRSSNTRTNYNQIDGDRVDQSQHHIRSKSLIVELMPLLPLQLCEQELSHLNLPLSPVLFDVNSHDKSLNYTLPSSRILPDLHKTVKNIQKNGNDD